MTARSKRRHLQRMRLYGFLWAVVFLALAGRLVQLTVMNREDAARWAVHQHQRIVELPPDRGSILDRNGELPAHATDLARRRALGKVSMADVRIELEAQIRRVLDAGVTPTHLDGH